MRKILSTIILIAIILMSFPQETRAVVPSGKIEIGNEDTFSTWEDVDLTDYLNADAGSVAGVILEVRNSSASEYDWGARQNGSTDARVDTMEDTGKTYYYVGIDDSDILEVNIEWNTIIIRLIAYIKDADGAFTANGQDVSIASGGWLDVDIAAETGGDTAVAAFIQLDNTSATSYQFGLRQNGSTDNRPFGYIYGNDFRGAAMSVDGSEIFEATITNAAVDFYLMGWLTGNYTAITNATDFSTGVFGSWVEVDFSGTIGAGNTGAFVEQYNGSAEKSEDIKIKTRDDEVYWDLSSVQYGFTEIDGDRKAEQKIEDFTCDLYLFGYTDAVHTTITSTYKVYGSPSDAKIAANNAVWATVRGAATGTLYQDSDSLRASARLGAVYYIHRSFLFFDTAFLPDDATITAVVMTIYRTGASAPGTVDYHAVSSTASVPVVAADYNNQGATSYGSVAVDAQTSYNITFNATGRAAINKTGITKIALIDEDDLDNNTPTVNLYRDIGSSEYALLANDPYLTITFTGAAAEDGWGWTTFPQ